MSVLLPAFAVLTGIALLAERDPIGFVAAACLGPDAERQVLHGNAVRLLTAARTPSSPAR